MQTGSSERSVSVWEQTVPQRTFAPLAGQAEADVCVVGAGIGGLATARRLLDGGLSAREAVEALLARPLRSEGI